MNLPTKLRINPLMTMTLLPLFPPFLLVVSATPFPLPFPTLAPITTPFPQKVPKVDLSRGKSSHLLAVDLGNGVRVGPKAAGGQDIALLDLDELGVGGGGLDGGRDLLVLLVRVVAAEEDGDGGLALGRRRLGRVGAQAGGDGAVEVAGAGLGQLSHGGVEVGAAVDDWMGECK